MTLACPIKIFDFLAALPFSKCSKSQQLEIDKMNEKIVKQNHYRKSNYEVYDSTLCKNTLQYSVLW